MNNYAVSILSIIYNIQCYTGATYTQTTWDRHEALESKCWYDIYVTLHISHIHVMPVQASVVHN